MIHNETGGRAVVMNAAKMGNEYIPEEKTSRLAVIAFLSFWIFILVLIGYGYITYGPMISAFLAMWY